MSRRSRRRRGRQRYAGPSTRGSPACRDRASETCCRRKGRGARSLMRLRSPVVRPLIDIAPPAASFPAPAAPYGFSFFPPLPSDLRASEGERSAERRRCLRGTLRAGEARVRRLRGVLTSLAIGTSRLSALHRGISRLRVTPDDARGAGYSRSRREPLPAPPNGTVSGRRPSMSRDNYDYSKRRISVKDYFQILGFFLKGSSKPGDVAMVPPAARPRQAGDQAEPDRIDGIGEHDRQSAGRLLQHWHGRGAASEDNVRRERD
jgi:hypothetical protein